MSANLGISAFLVFVALSTSANGEDRVAASWYGDELRGNRTASGEKFDPDGLTAAHKTLPFGTCLVVGNPRMGKSVNVRVNDRGPFALSGTPPRTSPAKLSTQCLEPLAHPKL